MLRLLNLDLVDQPVAVKLSGLFSFTESGPSIAIRPRTHAGPVNCLIILLLLFLVVLYYTSGWGPDLFETCHSILKAVALV
jgi:hypothetical protein